MITTFFNDFWIQSFVTAKYWGRGPERWNAELLLFKTMGSLDALQSPMADSSLALSPPNLDGLHRRVISLLPLCVDGAYTFVVADYKEIPSPEQEIPSPEQEIPSPEQEIPSPEPDVSDAYDMEDDVKWPAWPDDPNRPGFQERMAESLGSNSFTDISSQELPLSASAIVQAVQRSPGELKARCFRIRHHVGEL